MCIYVDKYKIQCSVHTHIIMHTLILNNYAGATNKGKDEPDSETGKVKKIM